MIAYHPARLIVRNICQALIFVLLGVLAIPALPAACWFFASAWLSAKLDSWAMPGGWIHSKSQRTLTCLNYLRSKE